MKHITPHQIKKDIENYFEIDDIAKKTRDRPLPQLRGLFLILTRDCIRTPFILSKMGAFINIDHSSVIYWLNKIETEFDYEPKLYDFYNQYRNMVMQTPEREFKNIIVKDVNLRRKKAICF